MMKEMNSEWEGIKPLERLSKKFKNRTLIALIKMIYAEK
jgi:hypothetical protein